MEEIKMIQSTMSDSSKPIPLLICYYCRKNIPKIFLEPSNGQMQLRVSCVCMKEDIVISLHKFLESISCLEVECSEHLKIAETYCSKCSIWLCDECLVKDENKGNAHKLTRQELRIKCIIHKKPFSSYCQKCQINYCDECLEKQNKHLLMPLYPASEEELKMNVFKDIKTNNRQLSNRLISRIEAQLNNKNKSQMKEDIQSACDANELISKDLALLYQSLIKTKLAFKGYPSYEQRILTTIIINPQPFKEESLTIEEDYIKLKEHLEKNFILKQTPTNECIATLKGHINPITNLLQLKNGKLTSMSSDGVIKVWSLITLECIATFKGYRSKVFLLIQLNDGRLVSGPEIYIDYSIKVWSIDTLECLATLTGHTNVVSGLIQLKDERMASCSYDKTIKLWNTTTYECTATLEGHTDSVLSLAQLNDGTLASGSKDKTIRLWNTTSYCCIDTLSKPQFDADFFLSLNDGKIAFCVRDDSTVKLWTISPKECIAVFNESSIGRMIQLKDGRMVRCSQDSILIWSLTSNDCYPIATGHLL